MYKPKAIKGQTYPGFTKISITQARKVVMERPFEGFIVANKVNSRHFFKNWCLACQVHFTELAELNNTINEFYYYMDAELGNNVAIYIDNEC